MSLVSAIWCCCHCFDSKIDILIISWTIPQGKYQHKCSGTAVIAIKATSATIPCIIYWSISPNGPTEKKLQRTLIRYASLGYQLTVIDSISHSKKSSCFDGCSSGSVNEANSHHLRRSTCSTNCKIRTENDRVNRHSISCIIGRRG